MEAGAKGGGAHQGQFGFKRRAHGGREPLWRLHHNIQRHTLFAQQAGCVLTVQLILRGLHPCTGQRAHMGTRMHNTVNRGQTKPRLMRDFFEGEFQLHFRI